MPGECKTFKWHVQKGPFEMENTFTQHCLHITCEATFYITYNWIKYIRKQWMEVVSIVYLCYELHRLIKHFLIITFEVAWLIKNNVMCWNITLASFSLVVYVFSFQGHTTRRDFLFKPSKVMSCRTASPIITRKENRQLLEMIRIPSWNLPCTL